MECAVEEHDGVTVVAPSGEMGMGSVEAFQARIDELLRGGARYFVIDLERVSFIDSSGLAALVRLYKHVRIGEGDVRLARVPSPIMAVLDLTRLSRVFDIFPTTTEASASIRPQD